MGIFRESTANPVAGLKFCLQECGAQQLGIMGNKDRTPSVN